MTFRYFPLRFRFVARTTLSFPAFLPGNVIRSAFGASLRRVGCLPGCDNPSRCPSQDPCPYRTIFQPEWIKGPSGFRQPPRPFVLRANHLSGKLIEPGSRFDFQVFVFDTRCPVVEWLVRALQEWEQDGWGPGRSSVTLESVELAVSPKNRTFFFAIIDCSPRFLLRYPSRSIATPLNLVASFEYTSYPQRNSRKTERSSPNRNFTFSRQGHETVFFPSPLFTRLPPAT